MSAEPKLLVLSAPSGTGKSTIAGMLLTLHPQIQLSISYTTRPPRGQEQEGIHYFFVDKSEFEAMVAAGRFLEHAQVFGKHWYGTSRETVEKFLSSGKHVLFDIDVQGARALKQAFGRRCVSIFLLPPSLEELEARLRKRQTDSSASIEARLKTAKDEMEEAQSFDYQLVNHDLQATLREVEQILKKERCL